MLLVSVVLEVGVNVPVQVMSSLDDIVASAPLGQVTSSPLAKPDTADEKTMVRVGVSPVITSVSESEMLLTAGSSVSTS